MFAPKPPSTLARLTSRSNHATIALAGLAVTVLAFVGAFHGASSGVRSTLLLQQQQQLAGGVMVGAPSPSAAPLLTAHGRARTTIPARPSPPPSIGCTPTQRDAQAAAFAKATGASRPSGGGGNYMPSACASTSILAALQAADPTAGGALTLINVGANKGYGIAEVMALWRPDLGVTPASVHADLATVFPDASAELVGACGDAKEAMAQPVDARVKPVLTVHAVEPLPVNVPLLKRLAEAIENTHPAPPVRMDVHPGAVGADASVQLGYDPDECLHIGRENCQMAPLRRGLTPVKGWTLDSFWEELGFRVDDGGPSPSIFLKIDAEGYDGAVLMSAATGPGSALATVHALEFEYHGVGKWGRKTDQVRLEEVVEKLDGAGLDCYLEYGSNLVHLTGTCWTVDYEFFAWSNVLCVRRGGVWADAADGLATWKS